jgi:FKBP-type peptidyl-prolyl cis-trans isomerase 2
MTEKPGHAQGTSRAVRSIMGIKQALMGSGVFSTFLCGSLVSMTVIMGCAGLNIKENSVRSGDRVTLNFTCRLQNGSIAATTIGEIAGIPGDRRSSVFRERKAEGPLRIIAGGNEAVYGRPGHRGFEGEIVAKVAEVVVGMEVGETRQVTVTAERAVPEKEEPIIQVARVRHRPKEVRMAPDAYRERAGKAAEVGQKYTLDPAIPGHVVRVDQNEVVVRFEPQAGAMVDTPFGKGTVRDAGSRWEIHIDARPGSLVRTGAMVGRIVGVDKRLITVDYGHPFGGEALRCDVTVEKIEPLAKGKGR